MRLSDFHYPYAILISKFLHYFEVNIEEFGFVMFFNLHLILLMNIAINCYNWFIFEIWKVCKTLIQNFNRLFLLNNRLFIYFCTFVCWLVSHIDLVYVCWTKWCSSFEESKPFEGCWSLGCACCCCAVLVRIWGRLCIVIHLLIESRA